MGGGGEGLGGVKDCKASLAFRFEAAEAEVESRGEGGTRAGDETRREGGKEKREKTEEEGKKKKMLKKKKK